MNRRCRTWVIVALASGALLMRPNTVAAEDISGTVVRTLMLSENTRLVGDITCQVTGAPCIAFGASIQGETSAGFSTRMYSHR